MHSYDDIAVVVVNSSCSHIGITHRHNTVLLSVHGRRAGSSNSGEEGTPTSGKI